MIRLNHHQIMELIVKIKETNQDYEGAAILFNALYHDELEADAREAREVSY